MCLCVCVCVCVCVCACVFRSVCVLWGGLCTLPDVSVILALNINVDKIKNPRG